MSDSLPPDPATAGAPSRAPMGDLRLGGKDDHATGRAAAREVMAAHRAAEQFLADTVETVTPDLPAPLLLDYAARSRAVLARLVAARRALQGG